MAARQLAIAMVAPLSFYLASIGIAERQPRVPACPLRESARQLHLASLDVPKSTLPKSCGLWQKRRATH